MLFIEDAFSNEKTFLARYVGTSAFNLWWIIPVFFRIILALCLLLGYPHYSGNYASIKSTSLS